MPAYTLVSALVVLPYILIMRILLWSSYTKIASPIIKWVSINVIYKQSFITFHNDTRQ